MGALEGRLGAPTGWDRQDEHCPAAASGLQTRQAPELPWEQSSDLPGASGGSVPRLWNAHQADPQGSDVLPQQSLGRAINSPAKRGAANLSGAGCPRGQELREPCGDGLRSCPALQHGPRSCPAPPGQARTVAPARAWPCPHCAPTASVPGTAVFIHPHFIFCC